jgi:glutamate N-acetyltransferase/amino-acid N-acetyltransferase
VIGVPLPATRMRERIPDLVSGLDETRFMDFARSIMTTDTRAKTVLLDGELSQGSLRIMGVAKGSGMIAPKMATMLAVVLVDLQVESAFLRECLLDANSTTFNCITVDGDTSTNDTLMVMAGGRLDAADVGHEQSDRRTFSRMLTQACADLARQIVLDGEGATKLVEIRVRGAQSKVDATRVARTIAESLLVKTAFAGEDPNWGRIIAVAGGAGVEFNPDRVDLSIGTVPVVREGQLVSGDWERGAARAMKQREFSVVLNLRSGSSEAAFLTSDLSEEYVRINADYRT